MSTLYFYKSFLRKVRSHLGEPARLTNRLLYFFKVPYAFAVVLILKQNVIIKLNNNQQKWVNIFTYLKNSLFPDAFVI